MGESYKAHIRDTNILLDLSHTIKVFSAISQDVIAKTENFITSNLKFLRTILNRLLHNKENLEHTLYRLEDRLYECQHREEIERFHWSDCSELKNRINRIKSKLSEIYTQIDNCERILKNVEFIINEFNTRKNNFKKIFIEQSHFMTQYLIQILKNVDEYKRMSVKNNQISEYADSESLIKENNAFKIVEKKQFNTGLFNLFGKKYKVVSKVFFDKIGNKYEFIELYDDNDNPLISLKKHGDIAYITKLNLKNYNNEDSILLSKIEDYALNNNIKQIKIWTDEEKIIKFFSNKYYQINKLNENYELTKTLNLNKNG